MGLLEYIKVKRGQAAHDLELQAMRDPFLRDAMDGLDAVSGDHAGVIDGLYKKIDASAAGGRAAARVREIARRDGRIRGWSTAAAGVLVAAAVGAVWLWPDGEAPKPASRPVIHNDVQEILPPVTIIEDPIGVGELHRDEIRAVRDSVAVDSLRGKR